MFQINIFISAKLDDIIEQNFQVDLMSHLIY